MPNSANKPVLLIRADGNQDDADALAELGLETVIDPYIRIDKSTDTADANRLLDALKAAGPKWLIATSVNAIKCFGELVGLDALKAAIGEASDLKFAAVGARTAASLRALGATDVLTPELADSAALAEALASLAEGDHSSSNLAGQTPTAIIPAGLLAMKGLPNKLVAAGWHLIQGVVYTTVTVAAPPTSVAAANAGDFSAVIFRSPSAARAFLSFVAKPAMPLVAAGFTTAKVIEDAGLVVASIPSNPTPKSVAAAVKSLLEGDR
jgi:uroporphyrinogen-III synthase